MVEGFVPPPPILPYPCVLRMRRCLLLSAALCVTVQACSTPADQVPDDGPQRVGNPVYRSDPDAQLTAPTAMVVTGRGDVLLTDNGVELVQLDRAGSLLRRMGRRGGGPGEYNYIASLQILGGDTLLVFDAGHARFTLIPMSFDRPPRIVSLVTRSAAPSAPYAGFRLRGERFFIVERVPHSPADTRRPESGRKDGIRQVDPTGNHTGVTLTTPSEEDLVIYPPGGVGVMDHPFGHRSVVRPSGDSLLVIAWSGSGQLRRYDPSSGRQDSVLLQLPEHPVTTEQVTEAIRDLPEIPQLRSLFVDALLASVPERWPRFSSVLVDDNARVWLEGPVRPGYDRVWHRTTKAGAIDASVQVPFRFRGLTIADGVMYGTLVDETDVPVVVGYQLPPTSGSGQ